MCRCKGRASGTTLTDHDNVGPDFALGKVSGMTEVTGVVTSTVRKSVQDSCLRGRVSSAMFSVPVSHSRGRRTNPDDGDFCWGGATHRPDVVSTTTGVGT